MVRVRTQGTRATPKARTGRRLACPSCGSLRLDFETGMIVGQLYRCRKCDYLGSLAIDGKSNGQRVD